MIRIVKRKISIEKVNFRSTFIEQIDKLYDKGSVDVPTMVELDINYMDSGNSIRIIAIKQYINFLAKSEGKINLGLVTLIVQKTIYFLFQQELNLYGHKFNLQKIPIPTKIKRVALEK